MGHFTINIKDRDPRPVDYRKWVDQYRLVQPLLLNGAAQTVATRTKSSSAAVPKARTLAGLEPYSGPWELTQVAHLLRRTLFGVKSSELDTFKGLTANQAVDRLLQASPKPAPPANYYNDTSAGVEDPTIPYGETWITAPYNVDYEGPRVVSLKSWWIGNILNQEATLHEKLVLFWHNLLATQSWDIFIAKTSYQYIEMLRRNAFGNFKTMIKELTLDPAMLLFLNGTRNNKEAPDENYSRELQELFCIGKGPGSQYTEGDVQAAARVLTGWVINWEEVNGDRAVSSHFWGDIHDTEDKQFSEFYGNRVITGRSGAEGAEELDDLLDMIFDNQETALYISRRLYQFFVYSEIDDTVEQSMIAPMADILRSNNYEILPVLEVLFKSAHFFDPVNHGALIKSPLDHVLGLWRGLEVKYANENDPELADRTHTSMIWNMASKGLEIADPPSVSGWPAYYQAPQFDKAWITTDTISSRAVTSDSLVYWGFWVNEEVQTPADLLAFISGLPNPEDPNQLIQDLSDQFLGLALTSIEIAELKTILLSGQANDFYWSNAWSAYMNEPGNEEFKLTVQSRLQPLFQRLFQRAEFQLM